jgi:transposase
MSGEIYSSYEMRLRAARAVCDGMPVGQVAQAYGVDRATLFRWVTRYKTEGDDGLKRRPGSFMDSQLDA